MGQQIGDNIIENTNSNTCFYSTNRKMDPEFQILWTILH